MNTATKESQAQRASWLNMVEIEIGVVRGQFLDRRIDEPKLLHQRNRRMGKTTKHRRRTHQMDVHNRKSPRQNGIKFYAGAEEVLAKLPRCGIPMVLRELKDGNAKPFAFSTMQHIVQRVRKATGEVDYVEALVH